ncbi:MAG: Hpt domain-containing protein, partial [Sphaerospermopsis kisseleviana]
MKQESDFSHLSLLDLFSMEVKAQGAVLNDSLLALETKPHPTEELAALMRAAHSIKGAARIVQIDPAVTLAHKMEDCFVAAQSGTITLTPVDVDVLLQAVDLLLQMADSCVGNSEPHFDDDSIQILVNAIANIISSAESHKEVGEVEEKEELIPSASYTVLSPQPPVPSPQ